MVVPIPTRPDDVMVIRCISRVLSVEVVPKNSRVPLAVGDQDSSAAAPMKASLPVKPVPLKPRKLNAPRIWPETGAEGLVSVSVARRRVDCDDWVSW